MLKPMSKSNKLKIYVIIKLLIIITIPTLMIILPLNLIENIPSFCFFYNIFKIPCPGCGITRAFISLSHLEIYKAINYNPSVIIVFPILAYHWLINLVKNIHKLKKEISYATRD